LLIALPLFAGAAEPNYGQREFQTRCAMCHGAVGRGDGWLAQQLIQRPPSLTQLKKNNGGTFPRDKVTRVIDGRTAVKTHGPSEMPVWGAIYQSEIEAAGGPRGGTRDDADVNISYRLQALVDYLVTLQQ
jgi:mono/diheme cytochrome c family protein